MKNYIVGIYSPQMGAGKTTVASELNNNGFVTVKFAGALKAMMRACLEYQGLPHHYIDRMLEGDLKEVPSPYLSGRTSRYGMQTIGTEWGRDIMDPTMWLNTTLKRIEHFSNPAEQSPIVIDDLRFENEYDFLKRLDHNVVLVKITRHGLKKETSVKHVSDSGALDHLPFDIELVNGPHFEDAKDFAVYAQNVIFDYIITTYNHRKAPLAP